MVAQISIDARSNDGGDGRVTAGACTARRLYTLGAGERLLYALRPPAGPHAGGLQALHCYRLPGAEAGLCGESRLLLR